MLSGCCLDAVLMLCHRASAAELAIGEPAPAPDYTPTPAILALKQNLLGCFADVESLAVCHPDLSRLIHPHLCFV
jgi:hypothetical protein